MADTLRSRRPRDRNGTARIGEGRLAPAAQAMAHGAVVHAYCTAAPRTRGTAALDPIDRRGRAVDTRVPQASAQSQSDPVGLRGAVGIEPHRQPLGILVATAVVRTGGTPRRGSRVHILSAQRR